MLEGKSEKLEFQETLSSPRRKNRSEQEQNKDNEKGIKRNGEWKNDEKERWMKRQWKMIFHEKILG